MHLLILRDSGLVDPAQSNRTVAIVSPANLMASEPRLPEKVLAPAWLCWSGWSEGDEQRGPEEAVRDFRTWSRDAWGRLERWCDDLTPELRQRGIELWIRPHARHILADTQCCLSFLGRRQGGQIRLLFEPTAFLTAGMLDRSEEHLERAFASLGAHPSVAATLLSNRHGPDDDPLEGPLRAAPLHRGCVDPALLVRLWRQYVPRGIPAVLLDDELEAQVRCLGPV